MNTVSKPVFVLDDAKGGNMLPLNDSMCNGNVCVRDFLVLLALFVI
jgi:hypothetical protein